MATVPVLDDHIEMIQEAKIVPSVSLQIETKRSAIPTDFS